MIRRAVHLFRMRIREFHDGTSVLDNHELHPITKSEVWYLLLATESDGRNDTFDTPSAETTRNQNALILSKRFQSLRIRFKIGAVYPIEFYLPSDLACRVLQRFDHADIGIRKDIVSGLEVLPYHADPNGFGRFSISHDPLLPYREIVPFLRLQTEFSEKTIAQVILFEIERHIVDAFDIGGADHVFLADAAVHGQFLFPLLIERTIGTSNDEIRLYTRAV